MKGVFIGILLTLINGSVFSATITSNGSGDWETGATWVGGVAPADGDDIIIAATHIVTIDGTGDISLNNVTISIFGTLLMDNDGADFANLTLTGTSGLAIEVGGAITEGVDDFTQEPFTNISLNGDVIWNACTGGFGELFVCLLTTAIATGGDLPELIAAQTTTPAGSRTLLPDDAANPLPVEFLFFTANYNNGGVLLEWATATEETNSHFEVERSIDAVNFEMINLVQGAGDSKARIDYSYSDQETRGLQATNLYYRLKQVDYDGEFEYSKTVIARNEDFTQQKLVVYPNPFEESVTLTLDAPNEEDVIISVFSADGRIAYSETKLVVQGRNDLGFDRLEQLPPGVYNLTVRGPSLYHNERLIKRN